MKNRTQIVAGQTVPAGHKRQCRCPFCKRARGENPTSRRKASGVTAPPRKGGVSARRLSRKKKNLGEELIIFGNPSRGKKGKKVSKRRRQATLPKRIKRAASPRRVRKNPAGSEGHAVKLFERFHGRQAQEILGRHAWAPEKGTYTVVGDLVAIGLDDCGLKGEDLAQKWEKSCQFISFHNDGVKLASSPDGRQLYFIGGNQNLEKQLEDLADDPTKDLIDLGDAYFVTYDARKIHTKFVPTEYTHAFGEGGGTRPRLGYNRAKRELFLTGGKYFIDLAPKVSPGIEG
jgi:hypothetical protein